VEEDTREFAQPDIDKRQHRRAKLITQVRCEALGREAVLLTRDVSVGGMFVNAQDPFPMDAVVSLAFRLDPLSRLFTCRGTVAYAIPGLGMGVKFDDLSDEVRQALQKFVDEAN
jgi:uncharacterized protein (TIGR02266 family)